MVLTGPYCRLCGSWDEPTFHILRDCPSVFILYLCPIQTIFSFIFGRLGIYLYLFYIYECVVFFLKN